MNRDCRISKATTRRRQGFNIQQSLCGNCQCLRQDQFENGSAPAGRCRQMIDEAWIYHSRVGTWTAQTVRSLYLIQKRTIRIPWLETFDLPENGISCGRRECSTVAPQSLTLMNGGLSAQAAQAVADGMNRHGAQNSEQQSRSAFRMILQRNPSERELDTCVRFLENRTVVELCLALFNSNEFARTV